MECSSNTASASPIVLTSLRIIYALPPFQQFALASDIHGSSIISLNSSKQYIKSFSVPFLQSVFVDTLPSSRAVFFIWLSDHSHFAGPLSLIVAVNIYVIPTHTAGDGAVAINSKHSSAMRTWNKYLSVCHDLFL